MHRTQDFSVCIAYNVTVPTHLIFCILLDPLVPAPGNCLIICVVLVNYVSVVIVKLLYEKIRTCHVQYFILLLSATKLVRTVIAPNFDTIFTQNIFFSLFSLGDPPIKIHSVCLKSAALPFKSQNHGF